jgi:hypothetical protein
MTTLRQEVNFMHSYFYLLKTRFGSGIQLNLRIEEAFMDYLLRSAGGCNILPAGRDPAGRYGGGEYPLLLRYPAMPGEPESEDH